MSFHYWRNRGRPRKHAFVGLAGGYHGETVGALAVTDVALFRDAYAPLLRLAAHAAAPGRARAPRRAKRGGLRAPLRRTRSSASSPSTTTRSPRSSSSRWCSAPPAWRMHDADYLRRARALCDRYDVHLIADEIMTGLRPHRHAVRPPAGGHPRPTSCACPRASPAARCRCRSCSTHRRGLRGLLRRRRRRAASCTRIPTPATRSPAARRSRCSTSSSASDVLARNRARRARASTRAVRAARAPSARARTSRRLGMIWAFDVADGRQRLRRAPSTGARSSAACCCARSAARVYFHAALCASMPRPASGSCEARWPRSTPRSTRFPHDARLLRHRHGHRRRQDLRQRARCCMRWRARHARVVGMKPVAAGTVATAPGRTTRTPLALRAASTVAVPRELDNPVLLADAAVAAPGRRARRPHDRHRPPRALPSARWRANADALVVEGAGGFLRAAVARRDTGADLATALGLPVVLVVGLRLGCLNHALLTAEAIALARPARWPAGSPTASTRRCRPRTTTSPSCASGSAPRCSPTWRMAPPTSRSTGRRRGQMTASWLDDFDARARRARRSAPAAPPPRRRAGRGGAQVIVDGRPMLAFCSNDYLGPRRGILRSSQAARATAPRGYGVGAGASPLVSGHSARQRRARSANSPPSSACRARCTSTPAMRPTSASCPRSAGQATRCSPMR